MTDTGPNDHAFIHDNLAAYLAGGLDAAERQRFDAHINACPECFDAFTEARDADRTLQRTLSVLAPLEIAGGASKFEDTIVTHFREHSMNGWKYPAIRRAMYATAACAALAATGVFANFAIHQGGRFNNPLSQSLVAQADKEAPDFDKPVKKLTIVLGIRDHEATGPLAARSPALLTASDGTPAALNARLEQAQRAQSQAKKGQTPVYVGGDPAIIPLDDTLRTQVIPLNNIPAVQLSKDLKPLLSADADMDITTNGGSTSLVVTDTSAKINRLAQIVQKLDKKPPQTALDQRQLASADFADSAEHLIPYTGYLVRPDNAPDAARKKTEETGTKYLADAGGTPTYAFNVQSGEARDLAGGVSAADAPAARRNFATVEGLARESQERAADESKQNSSPGIGSGYQTYKDLTLAGNNYYAQDQAYLKDAETDAVKKTVGDDVTFSGGVLTMNGGTLTSLAGSGQLAMNSGGINESLSKSGAGTVNLSGNRSAGETTMAAGKAITTAGSSSINNGSTIVTNGNLAATNGPAFTVNGTVSTWTGGTTVNGGNLRMGNGRGSGTLTLGQLARTPDDALDVNVNGTSSAHWGDLPAEANKPPTAALTPPPASTAAPASTPGQPAGTLIASAGGNGWTNTLPTETPSQPGQQGARTGQNIASGDAHGNFARTAVAELPTLTERDFKKADARDNLGVDGTDDKWTKPDDKITYTLYNDLYAIHETSALAAATPPAPGTTGVPGVPGAPGTPAATRPGQATPPAEVDAVSSLKIIRNGTISFEVRSFDDAYTTVQQVASEEKGFVSSTNSEKLANGHVRGTIVVRVPPERLDRFLLKIRALGDLKAQQIGAADVTKQYTDIESELRGLRTMETRLLDLIKSGKGEVKDLVEAERQLGDYRVRIEKLEGEIRYYNNLVSLATITITAYEKDIAGPTAASEQEVVNVNVETEEVESRYQAARKVFDDAKGRIVESQLKNTDADHVAAHIVADIPPDKADMVANQLKQLGKVASFNRDRRQVTTGGAGGGGELNVQVEHKDTRFTIDLFNLANLAPRETTVIRVAVRDVEATYKTILAQVKQTAEAPAAPPAPAAASQPAAEPTPKLTGRVLSSNLTGQVPEQMAATVNAEVRAETADAILAAIRNSGQVLTSSLATNADGANTTAAKRGIQLTVVNIAAIGPKESDTLNIAVRDVDAAYKAALAEIRKNAPAPDNQPEANLLPPTMGRILSSNLNGTQPTQMTADIRAEIRSDQADAVLSSLKGEGEVLNASVTESPEQINVTRVKRGLAVRFINVAAVAPREVRQMRGISADVQASYDKLLTSLQNLAAAGAGGNVRVIGSSMRNADPRQVTANFSFEARREALDSVQKAFDAAGIIFPTLTITRSTDTANTLDSKVLFQVDEIRSAESLDPRRIITLAEEVENVDRARADLLKNFGAMPAGSYKEVDFSETRDASGRVTAHWTLDTPISRTFDVQNAIRNLGGIEKNNQEIRNTQVPDTPLAKERIDLTLVSQKALVESGKGFGDSVRAALSAAAGALLYSVYLVLTGLLFLAPFLLILWPIYTLLRRKKAPVKA